MDTNARAYKNPDGIQAANYADKLRLLAANTKDALQALQEVARGAYDAMEAIEAGEGGPEVDVSGLNRAATVAAAWLGARGATYRIIAQDFGMNSPHLQNALTGDTRASGDYLQGWKHTKDTPTQ